MRRNKTLWWLAASLGLVLPGLAAAAPAAASGLDAKVTLDAPHDGPVALSWGKGRLFRKGGNAMLGVKEVRVSIHALAGPVHIRCWAYKQLTIFASSFTAPLSELRVEELRDGVPTGEAQLLKPVPNYGSWFEWVADPNESGDYTYSLSSAGRMGVHSCLVTAL